MKGSKIGSDVNPEEKVCYNCRHFAWLVGIGQGLRCGNPSKDPKYQLVPSSKHTCELFEYKPIKDKK